MPLQVRPEFKRRAQSGPRFAIHDHALRLQVDGGSPEDGGDVIAGVIEGFYGPPWSHEARVGCIEHLAAWGANSYVWAPKAAPSHRDRWLESFSVEELGAFGELAGHRLEVSFLVGLTPGADATDAQVIDKLAPAATEGVRGFVLCFDDLPVLGAAARHRQLAHAVLDRFGGPVWLVPTHYAGGRSSPYLDHLCDGLEPAIEVMWTGGHVVCDEITTDDARQRIAATAGRSPLLWDNTPVNDGMMREALHLGPYVGRAEGLRELCSGVLVNPMEFPLASLPTLCSAMAWCRGEDPTAAWSQFVDDWGWRLLAEATAFRNDPHWPGERPDRSWWGAVARMEPAGLDDGIEPWIDAARDGAALAMAAMDLDASPPDDPGRLAATFGLLRWRSWTRRRVLTFGGGPRCRPVITNDASGEFTYDPRSFDGTRSVVDELVVAALTRP